MYGKVCLYEAQNENCKWKKVKIGGLVKKEKHIPCRLFVIDRLTSTFYFKKRGENVN